mgnify:FL=1
MKLPFAGISNGKRTESEEKLKVVKARAEGEINWDIEQARSSRGSWKDEFWTLVLAAPLIMCFIPSATQYVERGFVVLSQSVPEWYIAAVGAAIAAAFGYRGINKIMNRGKN